MNAFAFPESPDKIAKPTSTSARATLAFMELVRTRLVVTNANARKDMKVYIASKISTNVPSIIRANKEVVLIGWQIISVSVLRVLEERIAQWNSKGKFISVLLKELIITFCIEIK